jgi:hypothetical protein
MDIKSFAAIVAGALFLTISPAFAADVNQAGPIHIDGANVYPIDNSSSSGQLVVTPGSVKIDFTNTANGPATRVAFVLLAGGSIIDRTDDVGTFSKGATISYSFPADLYRSVQQVAVAKVTFADGTVWQNPNVPPERTPASVLGVAVATGY